VIDLISGNIVTLNISSASEYAETVAVLLLAAAFCRLISGLFSIRSYVLYPTF
jgi:hypothetical protein